MRQSSKVKILDNILKSIIEMGWKSITSNPSVASVQSIQVTCSRNNPLKCLNHAKGRYFELLNKMSKSSFGSSLKFMVN